MLSIGHLDPADYWQTYYKHSPTTTSNCQLEIVARYLWQIVIFIRSDLSIWILLQFKVIAAQQRWNKNNNTRRRIVMGLNRNCQWICPLHGDTGRHQVESSKARCPSSSPSSATVAMSMVWFHFLYMETQTMDYTLFCLWVGGRSSGWIAGRIVIVWPYHKN